ncbi:MAG: hypothetical protein M0P64_00330 [Candidatus Pacebacteria bacterium]|nr:hypothetical protein [Candidatus Paceibacterota bacterium]
MKPRVATSMLTPLLPGSSPRITWKHVLDILVRPDIVSCVNENQMTKTHERLLKLAEKAVMELGPAHMDEEAPTSVYQCLEEFIVCLKDKNPSLIVSLSLKND